MSSVKLDLISYSTTPVRKKAVRFADSLGLEFRHVKLINHDELPTVPISAFQDLKLPKESFKDFDLNNKKRQMQNVLCSPVIVNGVERVRRTSREEGQLLLQFRQPCVTGNFLERLEIQKVCLENCMVSNSAGNLSVTCIIRVENISFEKQVFVRHTLNNWQTWNESLASYIPYSSDGKWDKFSCTFSIRSAVPGKALQNGRRVSMAVRYLTNTDEFWDNNNGENYTLLYQSFQLQHT